MSEGLEYGDNGDDEEQRAPTLMARVVPGSSSKRYSDSGSRCHALGSAGLSDMTE